MCKECYDGLYKIIDMIMSALVKLQLIRDEMLLVISLLLLFFLDLAILYGEAQRKVDFLDMSA